MGQQAYQSSLEQLMDAVMFCRMALRSFDLESAHLQEAEQVRGMFNSMMERESSAAPQARLAFPILRQALSLDGCAAFCLLLAAACEIDGETRNLIQQTSGALAPSIDLCLSLYSALVDGVSAEQAVSLALPQNSPLRFFAYMEEMSVNMLTPLRLRPNILSFLAAGTVCDGLYSHILEGREGAAPLYKELLEDLCAAAGQQMEGSASYLYLTGGDGCGKKTIIHSVSQKLELTCVYADCAQLAALPAQELRRQSCALAVDAALGGMLALDRYSPGIQAQVRILTQELPLGVVLVLLGSRCPSPGALGKRQAVCRGMEPLSPEDFTAAFEVIGNAVPVKADPAPAYVPAAIGCMWEAAYDAAASARGREAHAQDFVNALRRRIPSAAHAQPLETDVRLSDIVLPQETLEKLGMYCACARQRSMARRADASPYGMGAAALLCGPPGTGKTMAACAVANELGLELIRIDLSKIMDKYIGETEKHLEEVFSTARERGCILFFDEADALFSKRTEVSSSNDRYANVETAYLLQSIEQYTGLIVLATNLLKNFDEAFLRRITVLVRFPMPDEDLRLVLWERAFSDDPDAAQAVDFALLAHGLEISPATINAAARMARILAADAGQRVTQPLVLAALRNELEKYGQSAILSALG